MTLRCRFAPSPNGRLHLGHAYSALLNADTARASGGTFLLRIEDIDTTRSRPEFDAAIRDDLAWLGILPEAPPRRQSRCFERYAAALAALEAEGLLYPAFESRGEIARAVGEREAATGRPWPRDPDGAPLTPFPRDDTGEAQRKLRRAAGDPFVLRLDMARALAAAGQRGARHAPASLSLETPLAWQEAADIPLGPLHAVQADPMAWGDVVLARKDVPASYHLAVVLDDADQGITHVIRGADLAAATSIHRLLQVLLGLAAPVYHHHRLILDPDGRKLAKRAGSQSLADLRAAGATPATIRRLLDLPERPGAQPSARTSST